MKPLHLIMAMSLLGAAWLAFFGDKTPREELAQLPARTNNEGRNMLKEAPKDAPKNAQRRDQAAREGADDGGRAVILALTPRAELIGEAAGMTNSDLFARQSWGAPGAPSLNSLTPPVVPASVPSLTYVGKKREDGIWEVYLAQQDQVFIAKEKTVIDGKYRIESIVPPKLMLTYLPLSQKQTVLIGEAQ